MVTINKSDFPAEFSSTINRKLLVVVAIFLRRSVDGKHFMRFQSETTVFKFQRRSLGGPYTLWKNLAMSLIEYFSPRTACSLGTQIIKVHRRALILLLCLIPCHRCENLGTLTISSHNVTSSTREPKTCAWISVDI